MNFNKNNLLTLVLITLGSATALTAADKSYCKKLAEMLCGKKSKEKVDPAQDSAYLLVKQKPLTQYSAYDKVHIAVAENINQRPYMEDRCFIYAVKPETANEKKELVCAVFDGHGGSEAVDYVQQNFSEQFAKHKGIEPHEALMQALQKIDHDLKAPQFQESGTTAIIAHIKNAQATIANVGDSRAILIRDNKVIYETTDHSLDDPREIKKIKEAGGSIIYKNGGAYVGDIIFYGAINMSRTLGNWNIRKRPIGRGITAKPDIHTEKMLQNDILVLASDGIWDVLPCDTVAAIIATVRKKNKLAGTAGFIKEAAEQLNLEAQKRGATDNTTAMILHFKEQPKKTR